MSQHHRHQAAVTAGDRGFTLIELLVVVVVIGVLAGIAVPTLVQQRNKGYDAQAKSDARNMQIAAETWFTDLRRFPDSLSVGTDYKRSATPTNWTYSTTDPETSYCIAVASRTGRTWYAADDSAGVTTTSC